MENEYGHSFTHSSGVFYKLYRKMSTHQNRFPHKISFSQLDMF